MARQSKRKSMQALSDFFILAAACLVTVGVVTIRHHEYLIGIKLIGWTFVPLALLLGFTWRTRCKVKTTRRKPCGNEAYGFLFGCDMTAGHWLGKFLVRLGLQRGAVQQLQHRHPTRVYTMIEPAAPQSQPIRVTVEDSRISICAFWVGVASAVAGIVQVIFTIH